MIAQTPKVIIEAMCRTARNESAAVPGLFALIFFTTFNNFVGGVFMALMDAYGLSLVSVQTWGTLWGFISLSFILGGLYIAKKGLGPDPLRILTPAEGGDGTELPHVAVHS